MDEQAGDADEALEGNGSDAPNAESAGAELRDADFSLLNDDSDPGSGGSDGTDAARLKQLESELASEREKHLRALADLENYKRSAIKERSQLVKYQGQQVFQDLLEVVDDMERALQFAEPVSEEAGLSEESQLREGVALIYKRFQELLKKFEVRGESAIGTQFDPGKHEALSQVPAPAGMSTGMVVSELKRAYFYKDRLLRPAQVVVASEQVATAVDDTALGGDGDVESQK